MHPFAAYLLWVLLATLPGCHAKECTEEPINAIETRIQITTNLSKFACHCIEPRGTVVKVLNRKIYHHEKVHSKFDQDALILRAQTSPKSCSLTWTDPDGERRNAPCKLHEPQDQTLKSTVEQTAAEPEESALAHRSTVITAVLIVAVLILIGCAIIIMGNTREILGAHLVTSPRPQIEEQEQLTTREDNGQEYSNPPEEDSTTTSWLQKKKKTTKPLPDQTGDTSGRELSAGLSGAKKKVNPRQEQPSAETGPLKRVNTWQELRLTVERSTLKKVKSWQELQPSGERTPLVPPIIPEITEKTDENTDFDTNIQEPEETENSDTKKYRMKSD